MSLPILRSAFPPSILKRRLRSPAGRVLAEAYDDVFGDPWRVWTVGGCHVFAVAAARVRRRDTICIFGSLKAGGIEHAMVMEGETTMLDADGVAGIRELYLRYTEGFRSYPIEFVSLESLESWLKPRDREFADRLEKVLRGEKS